MSNYSNPSASWQRRWLDDGWLVLGFKRREPGNHSTTTLTSNVACRILAVIYVCPGVSDLEQILLLLP